MSKRQSKISPKAAQLLLVLAAAGYVALRPSAFQFRTLEVLIFVSVLALGVILISLWSDRQKKKRIHHLIRVAEAIIAGNYNVNSSDRGADGIGSLAESINRMADHIRNNLDKIRTSEDRIREMAYQDPLTGLPNRRMFEELLEREVEAARRYEYGLALAILDVDNLKDINDSFGHQYGDLLLAGVSKRLMAQLRGSDVLARLAGDEFALILRTAGRLDHIVPAIQRLINKCREPFELDGKEILTSLSVGLCLYPEDGEGPQELMSNADFALYKAKREGRNKIEQFDQSMNRIAARRMEVEQDLRRAMDRDEFSLVYQPIISLSDRKLHSLEALVRWHHPTEGMVLPGHFVSLAEDTGLMPQLGYRVLMKACRKVVLWKESGYDAVPVSVNVSVRQLQAGDFVDVVERVLMLTGLHPSMLNLEITENMAAEGASVRDHLTELRNLGVTLAIDDFGTGYSSFSYLLKHRIDTIKIDRSFVMGIPENPDSIVIVKAIISLARNLELDVVAEGVETAEQLDFLIENGCPAGQGNLFLKPAPAAEIEPHLKNGRVAPSGPELVQPMAHATEQLAGAEGEAD